MWAKKLYVKKIILIFLFKCSITLAQQHVYFGLKAGLNRCQVIGDGYKGYYKAGFNGGLFIQLGLAKNCTSQIEILFNDKGSHYRYKDLKNNYILEPYQIRLYYIDFPLLFQYYHKKIIYELGLGFGYLRDQREYAPGRSFSDVLNPFNKTDESFNIGLGYSLNKNWRLNFRYNNSIVPIRKTPSKQYNSLFTLSLFYQTAFQKK